MSLFKNLLILICFGFIGCNPSPDGRYKISPPPSDNEQSVFDASIKSLSDAIRSSPSISRNYFVRAGLYYQIENFEQALSDIDRADGLQPNQAKYLLLKAKILTEQNKTEEASKIAKQVESLNLGNLDFYLLNTKISILQKDAQKASAYLSKVKGMAPKSAEPNYLQGLFNKRLKKDTVAAIYDFYKAIAIDTKHKKSYIEVIDYLKKHKLVDSALIVCNQTIEKFPKDVTWSNEKASIYTSVFMFEKAWEIYNQQFKDDSLNVEALINMGNMRLNQKEYLLASNHYLKAQSFSKNSANLFYLSGFCNEKLKNYSQAQQFYAKALKINPNLKQADEGMNRTIEIINTALGI